MFFFMLFFLNQTATTEIYTYSHTLFPHAALPICTLVFVAPHNLQTCDLGWDEVDNAALPVPGLAPNTLFRVIRIDATRLKLQLPDDDAVVVWKDRKSTRLNSSH